MEKDNSKQNANEENNKVTIEKQENKSRKYRKWIVLSFLLLATLIAYIIFRGEYLETLELGEQYISVFWQNFKYKLITFFSIFAGTYAILYITNRKIQKGLKPFFEEEKKAMPKLFNKSISCIIAIIISFFMTNIIMEKLMLFINSTAFEMKDPVLNLDIGYFIFGQPFLKMAIWYLFVLSIGLLIYTATYYIIAFNVCFENGINRETLKKSYLIKQLCNIIVVVSIFLAGYIFIETHNVGIQRFLNLNGDTNFAIYGAGIADTTIKLWGYRILSVIIVVSIIIATRAFMKHNNKKVIISLAVVPVYLLTMLIVLAGFELVFVKPNELDKQKEYIKANIENTKKAYNVNIDEINLQENEIITNKQLEENQDVIDNIAIINKDMVLKQLNAVQTNKGYYTYKNSQIARINVDNMPKIAYISPREIDSQKGTYNNKTYQYTHGNGVVVTSATSIDENGNLINLQKDFTPNNKDILNITEPRIYFGQETNSVAVVNKDKQNEFDYPIVESAKAENAENSYEGNAGLKLNFIDRIILAIKEKDLKIAFSGNVNSNSKILINRNIIQRAKTLLPNIIYDENPYLVTTEDGKLMWVLDGYTVSNNYPFSQRMTLPKDSLINKTEINYIRNSVKVLIDSYDGSIKFYITDRNDPIIMAYQKLYKDLFVNKDIQIPEYISNQFVYPQFLYNIQAQIMKRYHNVQADVLYREDDVWDIAKHSDKTVAKVGNEIAPYYTMAKTINNDKSELGLVLPYTLNKKQNLISYLVGTYENGEEKLTLYKYPSDSNVLGPVQIDNQLEQDERISQEIKSLNVVGTKVTKNMIIVPIDNSLLYIEPIFQQYMNEENSNPILRKVVVASGNKIAIGDNVKKALNNLLSKYAVDIEVENTDTIQDLIDTIIKTNNNVQKSTENNNWEMLGKDMKKLQELINKLEKVVNEERKEFKKEKSNNEITNYELKNDELINDELINDELTNNKLTNNKPTDNIVNNTIM